MAVQETELMLLVKTLDFAARKHKDQRRKDAKASPYINHPIALASFSLGNPATNSVRPVAIPPPSQLLDC